MSLSEFFSDQSETPVVYSPKDRVSIDTKGATKFQMLVAGSTNNIMDPILLELAPGDKLDEQQPQPGEQFGYVLKGSACLRLGSKRYEIGKGHCFYFESNCVHQISNEKQTTAQVLWVVTPPQM